MKEKTSRMSNQPRSNCVDAKTNAIALAFCVCALLCIYAPLYLIVHCTCVCGSFIFIRLLSSHTWCHALIHPSIQSIVFSFASRLIGSISSECIANTVSSHCGWHALFWLTLLSFDCNFIQKIRMSILAQRLSVCVCCAIYVYNIYFWFSDYVPWKFASRSNVRTFSLFSIAVWFPYFIFSIYLVLPFVQIFNVESEKVTAHYVVHCSTNTREHWSKL